MLTEEVGAGVSALDRSGLAALPVVHVCRGLGLRLVLDPLEGAGVLAAASVVGGAEIGRRLVPSWHRLSGEGSMGLVRGQVLLTDAWPVVGDHGLVIGPVLSGHWVMSAGGRTRLRGLPLHLVLTCG